VRQIISITLTFLIISVATTINTWAEGDSFQYADGTIMGTKAGDSQNQAKAAQLRKEADSLDRQAKTHEDSAKNFENLANRSTDEKEKKEASAAAALQKKEAARKRQQAKEKRAEADRLAP